MLNVNQIQQKLQNKNKLTVMGTNRTRNATGLRYSIVNDGRYQLIRFISQRTNCLKNLCSEEASLALSYVQVTSLMIKN
jgi:hypothetical protein